MFESLLEKLLSRIIGEYVEGISKDQMKVGIFNGNVEIKNIKIKKSVIDQLNIPFELKFGIIEHIKMKIPWTSLQSSAVEAYLKGLYIVIVPKDQKEWHLIQNDLIKNKHNFLHQYAQNLKDTITERIKMQQEAQGKEQGYFGKLVQKIIDNLQVEIQDIHIRIESPKQPIENCSLGVSLDHFKMFTCDENWNPTFVDSTQNTTVYKKLDIQNFYFYFNSEEKHFLTIKCQDNEDYFEMMKELIYKEETKDTQKIQNQEYLMNFSTVGKLVQKKLTQELVNDKIPQFNIEISLNECNVNIQQQQIKKLQGIINLGTDYQIFSTRSMRKFDFYFYRPSMLPSECATKAEEKKVFKQWWKYATKYSASQINRKRDNWIFISEALKDNSKKDFMRIYKKITDSKNQKGYDILDGQEKRVYENIIMTVDEKEIKSWLEDQIKESKIREELEKEKQKKQGYFGGWFNKQSDLKDDEKEEIENFVKDIFEQEDVQEIELPKSYPKIKFKFIQDKFCINLLKKDQFEHQKEKITIQAQNIEINYFMKKLGQKVDMSLQNFTINYSKSDTDDQNYVEQKIIYCNVQSKNFDKLLKLQMEEKPEEIEGLDTKVNLELGSINLIYHKKMIATLIDIFTMDQINQGITDHIKNQTQKKIRQAQDIGENVVKNFMSEQPKILITLSMKTPQIILPVDQNNIENSPCWVFHPGNLKVKGDTFTNNNNDKNLYDNYSVSLKNMKMLYCQTTSILLSEDTDEKQLLEDSNLKQNIYVIFKDFNIEIECLLLKKVFVDLNVIDARTKVNAHLNALQLNFTPSILKDLKEIANIFLDENTNYKITEKKKILSKAQKGSFINIKSDNKYLVYYAALYQNTVYLFENPKKDLQAQKEIVLEDKQFVYKAISLEISILENKKEIVQFHFDDFSEYESWKTHFIKVVDQIQERKLIFGDDDDGSVRKTNLSVISTDDENAAQKEPENQEEKIVEIDLKFHFEDLIVNINANDLYKLCSSNLYLNMIKKRSTIDVQLELHNFTLQTQHDSKLEYLITSNYEQSLACEILKSNYVQKQEKLIIINFLQNTSKDNSSQLAKISFGSVFFDIQPKRLAKLISLLMAENKTSQNDVQNPDSIQDLVNDNELTPQILEIYQNSDQKLDNPKNEKIDMSIELEIQAINVLLINAIIDAPLANLIIKDSQINVQMKKGAMDVQTDFNDLIVYDLTNYPNTLYKRDIQAIIPRQIFGKQESTEKKTLIHVEFSSKEPQIYNIGDDFVNSEVDVTIQGIIISFHMQVVMRILSFLLDQLLPSLQPKNDQTSEQTTNYEVDYLFKRQAYIALNKPYWMKMKVAIENVQCNLQINQQQFVRAYLSQLFLHNDRSLNKQRLIKNGLSIKPEIEGVWNDNYYIDMQDLNCVLVENDKEKKLTQGLHMNLDVQMMAYDLEYKFLTHAIKVSNYENIHMKTDVKDRTFKEMKNNGFYVDGAMIVKIEMLPFVAILGNHEYQALMGVLDQCVSKNDGYDHLFIKDFQQKEELKDPMNLVVDMKIHNISLVTLDNKKNDMVKSKVFLENFSLQMLTHLSQDSIINMQIEDLKGYHLIQKDNKYYEKGFIGDFIITDQFETQDMQELKNMFIQKLVETKYESKIQDKEIKKEPKFTFSMQDCKTRNIHLKVSNLKILAQTDVLLHLSQLTSMPPQEQTKEVELERKQSHVKKIDDKPNQNNQKAMNVDIEILDNFFVLTDAYFNKCLVTKGDIYLGVQMHPQVERDCFEKLNFETVAQEVKKQEDLTKSMPPDQILNQKQIFTMQIQMVLDDFEIFIADFANIYDGNISNVDKRQIILPWKLDLGVDQMQVDQINKNNPLPDLVTIFLIKGFIQKIELKLANRDLDTISSIMNYSLALMGENNQQNNLNNQQGQNQEQEVQQKNELYDEYTYFYVSFNIIDHILLNLVYEHKTIFAPTLMFKIRKLKIVCDYEKVMKAMVGFQIQMDYFNSDIFKWEPFIEKSQLKIEYQTLLENKIEGKTLKIESHKNENFNINISMPFIKKMKFLADTIEKINQEKQKELENLTENKILESLLSLKAENLNKESEIEDKNEKVYVSPIRITNNTGYDLEVIYYKKYITMADNNTPEMRNVKNDKIVIKNKDHMPLNIEESIQDYNEQQEGNAQTFNYKFLSFNVMHPDLQIKKVSGLNLEQNFARKLHLDGKQKNLKHYSLIYNSQNVNDLKEIEISSSMKIQNNIDKKISIVIKHPMQKYVLDIEPGQTCFIPFDFLSFLCQVFVDGKIMKWKVSKLESLQLKSHGYYMLLENDEYNFIFKIFRQKHNYFLTHLVAIPGIVFKNLLPVPIKIKLQNNKEDKEFTLQKQEEISISKFDISTIVSYRVKIQGFKESQRFKLIENLTLTYSKVITLFDRNERECNFNIIRLKHGFCHYNFAIYCDLILINETDFHYSFLGTTEKKKKSDVRIAGVKPLNGEEEEFVDKLTFIGSDKRTLKLKIQDHPNFQQNDYSNDIITQGLSSGVFQALMNHKQDERRFFLEVGYKQTLQYLDWNEFITTKVIHLTPKTLLYNKTKYQIMLKNQSFVRDSILEPEEKQPLYVFDYLNKKMKFLDIELQSEEGTFCNLEAIDLNKAGSKLFVLKSHDTDKIMIIRLEILIENDYVVVNFLDRTKKNDIYIQNLTEYNLRVGQIDYFNQWNTIIPRQCNRELAFVNPYQNSQFQVEILTDFNEPFDKFVLDMTKTQSSVVEIKKRHIQMQSQRQVPKRETNLMSHREMNIKEEKKGEKIFLETTFQIENDSRKIQIKTGNDQSKKKNRELKRQMTKKKKNVQQDQQKTFKNCDYELYQIEINKLGISLIAKYNDIVVEPFFFYLDRIEAVAILTQDQSEFQFAINYINIDNNYSALSKYPVFLTSQQSVKKSDKTYCINFHCVKNNNKSENLLDFDLIELDIKPLVLTTEYMLISVANEISKQLDQVLNSTQQPSYLDKYFNDDNLENQQQLEKYKQVQQEWQIQQFRTSNTWIHCKHFRLAQIKLILTFGMNQVSTDKANTFSDNANVNAFIKTIGVTFVNVDETPVTLPNLELLSIFESLEGFQNIMTTHIKDQLYRNAAQIVGNLDIIGNPVSLFSNVAGGVQQFFGEPVEGFVKGPIEGVYGIAKGSTSLVKVTAASAFNTVSKVTNSLASGLTSLSMDQEYLRQRNLDRAHKPLTVFDGVGRGFMSFGKGVYSGITGVFTKPISEIKKSGASGFFKGIAKGIGGLITKPIGGVFDAVSITADGIKNTVTFFDDKANGQKQRIPRVFYGSFRFFKTYQELDAQIMKTLLTIEKKKFENDTFLEAIKIESQNQKSYYIVLTYEHFIILDYKLKNIKMFCEIKHINKLDCQSKNEVTVNYLYQNKPNRFTIYNKENKILKIIKCVNYSRYIYYTSTTNM